MRVKDKKQFYLINGEKINRSTVISTLPANFTAIHRICFNQIFFLNILKPNLDFISGMVLF